MALKNTKKELTILSEGTEIDGEIKITGDMRMDGKIKGKLIVEGNLIVGKTGEINADVEVENCTLGGKIKGNVNVKEKIELLEGAIQVGDITTKEIIINEKAIFNGFCKMKETEEEKPQETKEENEKQRI